MTTSEDTLAQDSSPLSDLEPLPLNNLRAPPPAVSSSGFADFASLTDGSVALPPGPFYRIRKGQTLDVGQRYPPKEPQPLDTLPTIKQATQTAYSSSAPCPPALNSIDSPFQLQEYLSLVIRRDPHSVEQIVCQPDGDNGSKSSKGKVKETDHSEDESQPVDTDVWIYEHLRRVVLDFTTPWLTTLQSSCSPSASPETCSAMNTSNWMYLCASHGEEKQCCAIDYIIHTIDGTVALLNSTRHFPSRTYIPTTSLTHFGSIARRLSRVFSHAMAHHRDVYDACETETSLYARFYALCERFDLCDASAESLPRPAIVSSELEPDGGDFSRAKPATSATSLSTVPPPPRILQRSNEGHDLAASLERSDSMVARKNVTNASRKVAGTDPIQDSNEQVETVDDALVQAQSST